MSDDLRRLIEAVEMGTLTETECLSNGNRLPMCATTWDAFRGSVDAAIALCEVLLPGWWAKISIAGRVNHAEVEEDGGGETACADNMPSPARALLLAVLRAKLMETTHARH